MYKIIMFAMIFLLLAGCGRHCIAVDGSYNGIDGRVEYCYDYGESKKANVPVFEATMPDSSKEKVYSFTGEIINKIKDKLKSVVGIKATAEKKHAVQEILKIIEGEKK